MSNEYRNAHPFTTMQPSLSYPINAHLVGQPIVSTQPVAGQAKHFTRGVSMPGNANAAHQLRAMRLRGAGAGRDCCIGMLGAFVCSDCCEGICECIADIVCCPCEMMGC